LAELLDHGDALLRNGDVASARLFYERAAGAGDGRAALRLGATFDPEFLGRLGLGKLQANPAEARSWYSRARELGAADTKRQLNSLDTRQGNSFQ
jgi:TPR repeat protein